MTDKEISKSDQVSDQVIIDGVDVSGCNFTLERDGKIKCECCHATGFGVICDCESWKTCDYKNYKRKEQECEELKKELRQKKMTILMNNDHYFEVDKTNRKLKQALTEIKEITADFYKTGFVRTDCGATLINNNTCVETLDNILQKCEVLDE